MSGLKLAALYGIYPHRLGFCGPKKSSARKTLANFLSGKKVSEKTIRKILTNFKGAFSYYKLIAKCNNIEDPFDERVVKAYWLGNQLLENVSIDSLKEILLGEFAKPREEIPLASKAHHSFHVLVVGSVSGRVVLKGKLLDLCRIGWAKILKCKKNKREAIVEHQALQKRNNRYFFGKPVPRVVFWDKNFIPELRVGNWVALHWNHIVQVLNKKELALLKKYTQITINSLK